MESQQQTFSELLKNLYQNNLYERAIQDATKKYKIKHYRIQKLKPAGIKNLLKKNTKRQKTTSLEENNYAWAEGQLKTFVWLLVGYAYIRKIQIDDMKQKDFQLFSEIFEGYSADFLNYQSKFLIKRPQKVLWAEQQAKILNEVIKEKFQEKNWNTVAYQLYTVSQRTIFRTPKQCRERWLNHEDPVKNHSEWTNQQDIELLRFVKSQGKKWSTISRMMKSTRTEHMVKNRFTSLVRKASKSYKANTEKEIIEILMKLKKSEREDFDDQSLDSEMTPEHEEQAEPQIKIELQEIQHSEQYMECKKQDIRENEYFAPVNVIPQTEEDEAPQAEEGFAQDVVNFFEQDDAYQTDRYSDYFFTVPEPTKQI